MSQHPSPYQGLFVLVAGSSLTLVLGSIHAFSLFLEPLEQQFSASRSQVSMTYSLALVLLTLAVLWGPTLYGRLKPPIFVSLVCLLATLGTIIAAFAPSLMGVWFGYSVLFGFANGLGYGYALQLSAQATPSRSGMAMGIVTASYALGATLAPLPFKAALEAWGFMGAMLVLAGALGVIVPVALGLLYRAQMVYQHASDISPKALRLTPSLLVLLWLAYGSAVAAGLMAIGHATGIAQIGGLTPYWIVAAPIIIALMNMLGGFTGGWLVDRIPIKLLLMLLPLLSASGLFLLIVSPNSIVFGLGLIGLSYGAIIAVYPAAIAALFGTVAGARVYGKVFTAWGTAGLIAPWLAGLLFDQNQSYTLALGLAGSLALISSLVVWRLRTKITLS